MKNSTWNLFLGIALTVVSCKTITHGVVEKASNNDYMLLATLWYQKAAENKALYYQGYQLARWRLDEILESNPKGKLAVVTDIDETILDNSPYQAWCILNGKNYPEGWAEWTKKAEARALPGAVEFFNYAALKGVEVFYITNRKVPELESTIANLQKQGFPMVDSLHVMVRTSESNKEARRQKVAEFYEIVLLLGDNLNDFSDIWERQMIIRREFITDSLRNEFGKRFIIFPNPMYGDWENAILNYDFTMPPQVRDSLRKASLRAF